MTLPITRPKIIVPRRRSNILTRKRLLDAFEDIIDYKLVLVVTPPGYGKTTLLIDVAHQIDLPVCWYSLDALDQEPQRFLAHFIASIAQQFPEFGKKSSSIIRNEKHMTENIDQVVDVIVDDAFEHINEHFIMVLDDYHTVDDSELVTAFINRFIQRVDENFHLVISSRTLVSLPDLPLLVSRSQVWGLSFEELAFHPEEIRSLVVRNYHLSLSRDEVNDLAKHTEGWITGIILSAETEWGKEGKSVLFNQIAGIGFYDYWAQQVLDKQSPVFQKVLLQTSLLDEFNASICAQVIGKPPAGFQWDDVISVLMHNNLFVQPIDGKSTWLRYHHLFQDFLRARMEELYPKERAAILWRLANYYAAQEEWGGAYTVYLRLKDYDAAAQMIVDAGRSILRRGRLSALANWIDELPETTLDSRPTVLSLRGYVAAMLGDPDKGLTMLDLAAKRFEDEDNMEQLSGVLTWRAGVYRVLGRYRQAIADSEKVLELAKQIENSDVYVAEAYRNWGLCLYRQGKGEKSAEYVENALQVYTRLGEDDHAAQASADLGIIYRSLREYDKAEDAYLKALHVWQESEDLVRQVSILNNLGVLVQSRGEYIRAYNLFEEALSGARDSGYVRAESFALASIADLYLELEAYQAAHDAYKRAEELANQIEDSYLLFYILSKRVRLAGLGIGDDDPLNLIGTMAGIVKQSGSDYARGVLGLTAGALAVKREDYQEAEKQFREAVDYLLRGGKQLESARAYLSLAEVSHFMGDAAAALENIQRAFQLLDAGETEQTVVVLAKDFKDLLARFENEPSVRLKVSPLLAKVMDFENRLPGIRREIRHKAPKITFAPPRLEIRAFGKALVLVDGKPVTRSDWIHQRVVRSLFFYLLAHPFGVSKDVIGVVFWPESSNAQLKKRFKNAIYRLRQALGSDIVLYDGDLYWLNRDLDYEYDVETFRDKLALAEKTDDAEVRLKAYQEAIALYRGEYLEDIGEGWVILERELLRRAYQEALLHAADIRYDRGEYSQVIDLCERAIREDVCLEPAYRLEMQVFDVLGNRSGIVKTYKRCKEALERELGVPPSPQTEELYLYLTH